MRCDGHVHIAEGDIQPWRLLDQLRCADMDAALLISLAPRGFFGGGKSTASFEQRLDNLLGWVQGSANLFPFFWLNPLDPDAIQQVERCLDRGVAGFKIICDSFYPSDPRLLQTLQRIADRGNPVLFHSGILWDGKDSARYNRPGEFEALLQVPKLRFSLAHVSWPWHDECIAVYGKFQHARALGPQETPQMFIDLTPGTPAVYRREVLTKLLTAGYDIQDNLIFGSDVVSDRPDTAWISQWRQRDDHIYRDLNMPPDFYEKVYCRNLLKFIGLESWPAGATGPGERPRS